MRSAHRVGCALAPWVVVLAAGCAADGVPNVDTDMTATPPDSGGVLPPPPDLAGPDLSVGDLRDLAMPDLRPPVDMAGCGPGNKMCGRQCIPDAWCCTNQDCPAAGQTCQNDGTCVCPPNQKACLQTCIPAANCCVNADCPSKLCVSGTCTVPGCNDGLANGNETDIDCGGGFCGKCVATRACGINIDCRSNLCLKQSCVEVTFDRADFGGGVRPVLLRATDVDGDGKPDVLALNGTSYTLSVLLGRGDGTYRSVGSASVGVSPVEFDLGDLDGDGKLDAVVANSGSFDLSILLGNGDGSFQPQRLEKVGGAPTWVAIGDQNKDGKKDIVVANSTTGSVGLLLGNGNGTFKPQVETFTFVSKPRALVMRDFDGDGFDDVVVQCVGAPPMGAMGFLTGAFSFLRSRGNGTFDAPRTFPTQSTLLTTLVSDDLDRDGKLDLVVASPNLTNPQVFTGDGRGGFVALGGLPAVNAPWLQLVDMNGDKILDLVTASGIQLGNGNGGFAGNVIYPAAGGAMGSPAAADYDRDGKLDVALPQPVNHSVVTLPGKGDGTLLPLDPPRSGSETDLALISPRVTHIADLNGDGRGDLLVASGATLLVAAPALLVRLADGTGGLQPASAYPIGTGNRPSGIATGDFNKDKNLDVVVCNASDQGIHLLTGNANGTLNPAVRIAVATTMSTCDAADLDGDGNLDLVNATTGNQAIYLLGKGDGTFGPGVGLAVGTTPKQVILLDWNGDKNLDIVTVNRGSSNLSWLISKGVDMNNVLSFSPAVTLAPPGMPAPAPIAAAFSDLDGDGKPDLMLADNASANFRVYLNTTPMGGAIAFGAPTSYPTLAIPTSAVAADFNLDGKIDFATANNADRSVSVFLGKGGGQFAPMWNHDVSPGPSWIAAGDLNGDKKPDLATANQSSSTVTVLMNGL